MVKSDSRSQGTISSVHHAIDVIEFLSEHGPATVTEIAAKTGLPRPTLYRLLRTLEDRGITRVDRKRHRLSMRLHELGVRANSVDTLQIQVQPILDRVVAATGLTAHFAILDGDAAVYIARREGVGMMQMTSRVGWRAPLHCTATGKILMSVSGVPEGLDLSPQTANTITDYKTLVRDVEQSASRGFSLDDEEMLPGLRCVAVAVSEDSGVIGALSVSGRSDQILDPAKLAADITALL